jgi:1-acyl-sn-glycerol-3-phosphate acyltransferase
MGNKNLKNKSFDICYTINPVLGAIAMFVTQDIVLRFFFSKKKILNKDFSIPINSSIILAPTHRSRWDGLVLTMAMGRRVTKKDCRFMVTKSEMNGIQGWFLKRLGCFSINQLSPSLLTMKYAIDLIEKGEQLVVFPEGKINKFGKKLVLKEGLYRLARLAAKKTESIVIIPIGIAYSKISPKFRDEFCLSFGKPMIMDDYLNITVKEFNQLLNKKMNQEEKIALYNVGR